MHFRPASGKSAPGALRFHNDDDTETKNPRRCKRILRAFPDFLFIIDIFEHCSKAANIDL
jgi:hypothetical protein